MRGFIRSLIFFILVAGLILATYQVFGGDLGALAGTLWGWLYGAIQAVGNIFVEIFRIFGIG